MSKKSDEFAAEVRAEVETVSDESGGGFALLFTRMAKLWNLIDIPSLIPSDLTKPEVLAAIRKVWDEVIVPIDIPYVPEFLETILEGMCWRVIENKINDLFEKQVIGQ